jgi:hypothetical protein
MRREKEKALGTPTRFLVRENGGQEMEGETEDVPKGFLKLVLLTGSMSSTERWLGKTTTLYLLRVVDHCTCGRDNFRSITLLASTYHGWWMRAHPILTWEPLFLQA